MVVTKQSYTAAGTWTASQLADIFKNAFIDAGLMTDWHDSFTISSRVYRVLKVEYDNTKTYGTTYYYMVFTADNNQPGISIASGWDTSSKVPTGTQYIDYHRLPTDIANASGNATATSFTAPQSSSNSGWNTSTTSDIILDRYTSNIDSRQSWFVLRNGSNVSRPFTILPKTLGFYSWLDLSKGIISGYMTARTMVNFAPAGSLVFCVGENIRRCLTLGTVLRGDTSGSGNLTYHQTECAAYGYVGFGSSSNNTVSNLGPAVSQNGATTGSGVVALPVGKAYVNSAYSSDYVPICTEVPWYPYGSTTLASDFGVYMHYASNTINYGDKFIVSAGVEEWQVISRTNNSIVNDSATPTFLARVV